MPSASAPSGSARQCRMPATIESEPGTMQRRLCSGQLLHDVLAVRALVDQSLHAADLALGAAESGDDLVGGLVGEVHLRSRRSADRCVGGLLASVAYAIRIPPRV